jgi:hypothetical protein
MLKRKLNIAWAGEDNENCFMNTQAEITQRRIFRAKRPERAVSTEANKFKITTNLVSLEEEVRLLSLGTTQKINHSRTRSANPFDYSKFSAYSLLEPFKQIIQTQGLVTETQNLKGFLESNKEKKERVLRFEADCGFWVNGELCQGSCEIVFDNEEFLVNFKEKGGGKVLNGKITKHSICKETCSQGVSTLLVQFDRTEEVAKFCLSQVSKHLFLRTFAEAKSQSFFN